MEENGINGTKLILKYKIISGPFGNTEIKTEINCKPEKLPFESMYLKESPKEVLKTFVREYNVFEYKDLEINETSSFNYKKHLCFYGLSIKESNLEGVIINNSVYENVNLSFLPKLNLSKEELFGKVGDFIKKYIVTTHTKYGPIFQTDRGSESNNIEITENYFKNREKSKDIEKEKQLSQILEYAQIVLNNPNLSIKDIEKLAPEKTANIIL